MLQPVVTSNNQLLGNQTNSAPVVTQSGPEPNATANQVVGVGPMVGGGLVGSGAVVGGGLVSSGAVVGGGLVSTGTNSLQIVRTQDGSLVAVPQQFIEVRTEGWIAYLGLFSSHRT